VSQANTPGQLLQGTRSGFRDGWGEVGTQRNNDGERTNLGLGDFDSEKYPLFNHLPVNFNIAAFKAALADTASRELGDIFGAGRPFNGIVYITNTWPGWNNGMAAGATATTPSFWPYHGANEDCEIGGTANYQPLETTITPSAQVTTAQWAGLAAGEHAWDLRNRPYEQALPFPLCSGNTTRPDWNNWAGAGAPFKVANCDRYTNTGLDADDQLYSRPNSVRLFNGGDFTGTEWPDGLTIASNLPVFILGNYNNTSVSSDVPGTLTANWKPALVAADTVSLQSSNWDDELSPWNLTIRRNRTANYRTAGNSIYHFQILAGWLVSAGGSRDEVTYFNRLMENWGGITREVRGSIVIGFNSQYGMRFDWDGDNCSDDGTNKTYMYDYNLDAIDRQPPGAPKYTVNAVRSWRRD